jgi:hypothetical protein
MNFCKDFKSLQMDNSELFEFMDANCGRDSGEQHTFMEFHCDRSDAKYYLAYNDFNNSQWVFDFFRTKNDALDYITSLDTYDPYFGNDFINQPKNKEEVREFLADGNDVNFGVGRDPAYFHVGNMFYVHRAVDTDKPVEVYQYKGEPRYETDTQKRYNHKKRRFEYCYTGKENFWFYVQQVRL